MTTPGGTQFEHGDDFVAARVSIDIPTEGISGLREITQEMDRFRTVTEAAARAEDNFTNYLDQVTEAANRQSQAMQNLQVMLEHQTEQQQRGQGAGAGGPQPQLNAPGQYLDPFVGMAAGMGAAQSAPNVSSTQNQLDQLREQNPRAYLNMQAQRGGLRPGDVPGGPPGDGQLADTASRVHQREQLTSGGSTAKQRMGQGITEQVMNEMSPGGSSMGAAEMIQSLSGMGRMSGAIPTGLGAMAGGAAGAMGGGGGAGALMSGLGGLARVAGPAGAVMGGAMAYYGLTQGLGGMYQDYRNMGAIRGGGAGEGVGYEMAIKTMAMNPFISNDQSRAIIQQGLREGYTGKEFDTMTQFVASNLKSMNISISDSFDLVRQNVHEGGQSLVGLSATLAELKELSKTGARSLPELIAGYKGTSQALIAAGVPGNVASQAAQIAGQAFSEDQALKGTPEQLVTAMTSSPMGLAMLRSQGGLNVPPGTLPGAIPLSVTPEALTQGSENVIKQFALRYYNTHGRPPKGSTEYNNVVWIWYQYLRQQGIPWDLTTAKHWFDAFVEGRNPMAEGEEKTDKARGETLKPRSKGILESVGGGIGGLARTALGTIRGTAEMVGGAVADLYHGEWAGAGEYFSRGARHGQAGRYGINPFDLNMGVLKSIEEAYGPEGYEILNEQGQAIKFRQSSAEQMTKLATGQYTFRPKGSQGSGQKASEISGMSGADLKNAIASSKTSVTGEVTITLDPAAQKAGFRAPPQVKLTPHEQQANSGYGNATPNNAPPGYDMPRSRYGGSGY